MVYFSAFAVQRAPMSICIPCVCLCVKHKSSKNMIPAFVAISALNDTEASKSNVILHGKHSNKHRYHRRHMCHSNKCIKCRFQFSRIGFKTISQYFYGGLFLLSLSLVWLCNSSEWWLRIGRHSCRFFSPSHAKCGVECCCNNICIQSLCLFFLCLPDIT